MEMLSVETRAQRPNFKGSAEHVRPIVGSLVDMLANLQMAPSA